MELTTLPQTLESFGGHSSLYPSPSTPTAFYLGAYKAWVITKKKNSWLRLWWGVMVLNEVASFCGSQDNQHQRRRTTATAASLDIRSRVTSYTRRQLSPVDRTKKKRHP